MTVAMVACSTGKEDVNKELVSETELQSLQFWLDHSENTDNILMTSEEIQKQNNIMLSTWGTDWELGYYDITAFPEVIDANWLKDRICYLNLMNTKLYKDGELITQDMWNQYYINYNLESISEDVKVSYGVTNHYAPALDLPTNDIFTSDGLSNSHNALQETLLKINEPIVVLHTSTDNQWVFVVANEFIGWIKSEYCSYFSSRQEWIDYQKQQNYIIVTNDTAVTETNIKLSMGTKLYLETLPDETTSEYNVIMPQKDESGFITYGNDRILNTDAVNVGYLPFTRSNILKLAFQELGDSYGWGGIDGKRDCSSYLKDIYACFGFQLPRNSRLQQTMPNISTDISEYSEKDKMSYLDHMNAGDILGIRGHMMMYLGKANDKYYVISMLSSYVPESVTENFANSIESINTVFINSLNVNRANGNTWLQELCGTVKFE